MRLLVSEGETGCQSEAHRVSACICDREAGGPGRVEAVKVKFVEAVQSRSWVSSEPVRA